MGSANAESALLESSASARPCESGDPGAAARLSRIPAGTSGPCARDSIWRDQRGTALIEGAIVFPVLLLLLAGVFEFSWLFYQQHLVTIGLHEAAAYLARSPDPCNEASKQWKSEMRDAKALAISGSLAGGAPRVRGWTADKVTAQCEKVANPAGRNGLRMYRGSSPYVVTVSTKFAYSSSLGFFSLLRLRPGFITASYSARATEMR